MNTDLDPRLEDLFNSALEQEPDERAAFIEQACGGDAALREQLESLLAADDKAQDFMEAPAMGLTAAGTHTDPDYADSLVGQHMGQDQGDLSAIESEQGRDRRAAVLTLDYVQVGRVYT